MLSLTPEALAALRHCYHNTSDADLRTHCQMVLLTAAGYSPAHIAAITLSSEASVRDRCDRYTAAGLAGLRQPFPAPPAESTLRPLSGEELTFYRLPQH